MTKKSRLSAHTPGPFRVYVDPGDGLYVAQVEPEDQFQIKHLCKLTRYDEPEENAANAMLFAAAPDLLRQLKIAHRFLERIAEAEIQAVEHDLQECLSLGDMAAAIALAEEF